MSVLSTSFWLRRGTASAGDGTGSTSLAMPTPRATSSRRTGVIRMPTPIATTSSQRSTPILPYDQFVVEQIAADQLSRGNDNEPLAALGFLTVGRRFLLDQNEIIDDRIDVVTRGLLGLTVTCARCHDHKFDPIPTEDYYSLYGVFASSIEPAELPLLNRPGEPSQIGRLRAEVEGGQQGPRRLPGAVGTRAGGDLQARSPLSPGRSRSGLRSGNTTASTSEPRRQAEYAAAPGA